LWGFVDWYGIIWGFINWYCFGWFGWGIGIVFRWWGRGGIGAKNDRGVKINQLRGKRQK